MSGYWKNRRERSPFDIFEEFKEIEKILNEFIRQTYKKNKRFRPRVYVFSIRTSPPAGSKFKGWGNVDGGGYVPRVREQREALIDVLDKKEEVVVVAELPNVKKEDLELYETGDVLTISLNKPQRKNLKTIELPAKVNVKEAKINYKNGVLEVTLPKIEKEL